jgi:cellulose synthase/poly-beta-1,6-N-acetylglucosamine synthase-like glycosyltransferase
MFWVEVIFWVSLGLVFYTHIGYGLLIWVLTRIKKLFVKNAVPAILPTDELPAVTYIVAAYNEEAWISEKIENSLRLQYPSEKLLLWFVTDGSNDNTPAIVAEYASKMPDRIQLFHQPERRGKIAAVERVMEQVRTPVTVFSDANTKVNPEAIHNIVRHYHDEKVGAVAGEKRIHMDAAEEASAAGEGIYWKYESFLKQLDNEFYSTIGAAGELFSIRTELYRPVEPDTLIEDFVMTMRIAMGGYKIAYEPAAYAVENGSASVKEELKRKVRIAAGALQAIYRLRALLNPFKYGRLSFQYISHRMLRWTLAPLALPVILISNIVLAGSGQPLYQVLLGLQVAFYLLALAGWLLEKRKVRIKILFIPYYFLVMNYAMFAGAIRLLKGQQSVLWEKAARAK